MHHSRVLIYTAESRNVNNTATIFQAMQLTNPILVASAPDKQSAPGTMHSELRHICRVSVSNIEVMLVLHYTSTISLLARNRE